MSILVAVLTVLALSLQSCGSEEGGERKSNGQGNADSSVPQSEPGGQTAQRPVESLKGFYVFGHQTNTFWPCGTESPHWVVGEFRTVERLKMQYSQIVLKPYEEVYAELRGRIIEEPSEEGIAAGVFTQFHIEEVIVVRSKREGDCTDTSAGRPGQQ